MTCRSWHSSQTRQPGALIVMGFKSIAKWQDQGQPDGYVAVSRLGSPRHVFRSLALTRTFHAGGGLAESLSPVRSTGESSTNLKASHRKAVAGHMHYTRARLRRRGVRTFARRRNQCFDEL